LKLRPLQDRILLQRVKEDEKTKGGIIIPDTAKVVRFAIQNAASVASSMLTTQAMMAEKPEEKKADASGN